MKPKTTVGSIWACVLMLSMAMAVGVGRAGDIDEGWVGTWKLDMAKSHFVGDTVTYTKAASGLFHVSAGGDADYDFGIDGKEYPSAYGRTTVWTAVGNRSWDTETRAGGVVLFKVHRELSADNHTLTVTETGANADGSTLNNTTVYTRVSGTAGLLGKWRDTRTDAGSPSMFVISMPSPGVLRWDIPQWKQYAEGRPDGTDLVINGVGNAPPGMTFSAKRESPRKITYIIKYHGKPDQYGVQTLSADGRSYTDVSWAPGREDEKGTGVYEKQ